MPSASVLHRPRPATRSQTSKVTAATAFLLLDPLAPDSTSTTDSDDGKSVDIGDEDPDFTFSTEATMSDDDSDAEILDEELGPKVWEAKYKGKAGKAKRDELEAVRLLKIKHEEAYLAQRGAELEAMYESCRVEAERRAVAAMQVEEEDEGEEEEDEGEEEVREQGEEDESSSGNDDIDIDEDCDDYAAEVLEEELKSPANTFPQVSADLTISEASSQVARMNLTTLEQPGQPLKTAHAAARNRPVAASAARCAGPWLYSTYRIAPKEKTEYVEI